MDAEDELFELALLVSVHDVGVKARKLVDVTYEALMRGIEVVKPGTTVGDIGHASGPLLAGLLIATMSYQNAFAVIATMQLVAAALFWLTMRRYQ